MELQRDSIEFHGKYQLLNVSNPALAFGKLKWIFSGRCFSPQLDSPRLLHVRHKRLIQETTCYSAVKFFLQTGCSPYLRPKVMTSVVDGEQLMHYSMIALSLASSPVSPTPWPCVAI